MEGHADDPLHMSPEAVERWDYAYRHGWAPWDIGAPQPAFVRLADAGRIAGPVLDVGCGTGEHALMLAARGYDVLGVDIAATALAAAQRKAADRRLGAVFQQADALDLESLGRRFNAVIDSGVFHTFDDGQRTRYVESLASAVESGGSVHLLCFSEQTPGEDGPRRVTQGELRAAFDDGWQVESIEAARFEVRDGFPGERPHAWLAQIVRANGVARSAADGRRREPLPSNPSAGNLVAGLLAGVDHMVVNRPRPVAQIEEEYHEPWASADGMTVDGLDEKIDRPEPPDTSGARL
jgi:SAM-dependent methyltransferase